MTDTNTTQTVSSPLENKTILLTGGTGSFGQAFTHIALDHHNPKAIRIFSRGEYLQYLMEKKFHDDRLRFFIGDVRDKDRLMRAMMGADIIVHAAALKQIPTVEYNPIEAINTNIGGSVNVINAAIDSGIEKAIAISTDKSCLPYNLYGGTKMVMEKLFIQANSYTGVRKTRFACVRYGNVFASRGSVYPAFLEQKKTGILQITDTNMTRFWVTLEAGVNFVISSLARMHGGEIFVPKLPSMRVIDLADVMAPECEKVVVGIRPGEKMHEVLISESEAEHTKEFDSYFIIEPQYPFWSVDIGGKCVPNGFRYSSDSNFWWLKPEELKEMIEGINDVGVWSDGR